MSLQKLRFSYNFFLKVAGLPGLLFCAIPVISFLTARVRDINNYSSVDGSAFVQILFVLLSFLSCVYILISNTRNSRLLFQSPQMYLLLYSCVCLLSMFWSPKISITGFRAFEAITYILLISIVVYRLIIKLSSKLVMKWALLWILWFLLFAILSRVKLQGFSFLLWPFFAARLAMPIFFFFALFLTDNKYIKYTILTFCILCLSNKIYFGIIFGMSGLFFGDGKYKGVLMVSLIGVFLLYLIFGEAIIQNTLFYGRESISMEHTSGRDKLWRIAIESFIDKPFVGYGYVSGESEILHQKFQGPISTHNFIFSGLLSTGLLGIGFLLMYFTSMFKIAISHMIPAKKWRPAFVATTIMCLIVSLTAPGLGGRVYGSWIPVVFVFTIMSGVYYKAKVLKKVKVRR